MAKRLHPVKKLQRASKHLWENQPFPRPVEEDIIAKDERLIARHVKPLLDELSRGVRIYYPAGPNYRKAVDLLIAWRAER